MRPLPQAPPTGNLPSLSIDYQKWQTQALTSIATLAPSLSEAALRLLIELTRRGLARPDLSTRASMRDLSTACNIARSALFRARDELTSRGLILCRSGSASAASGFRLTFLETLQLTAAPGPVGGPPLVLQEDHPGPVGGPPPTENTTLFPLDPAPVDIDKDPITTTLDRALKAKPSNADPAELATVRSWVHGYHAKFGRTPNPHPPDDRILAQMLAVATPSAIQYVLLDLMGERKEPGSSYAWYVTVLLQRLHGFSPAAQAQARTALKLIQNPRNARTLPPPSLEKTRPSESPDAAHVDDQPGPDLIRRLASAKTMP